MCCQMTPIQNVPIPSVQKTVTVMQTASVVGTIAVAWSALPQVRLTSLINGAINKITMSKCILHYSAQCISGGFGSDTAMSGEAKRGLGRN